VNRRGEPVKTNPQSKQPAINGKNSIQEGKDRLPKIHRTRTIRCGINFGKPENKTRWGHCFRSKRKDIPKKNKDARLTARTRQEIRKLGSKKRLGAKKCPCERQGMAAQNPERPYYEEQIGNTKKIMSLTTPKQRPGVRQPALKRKTKERSSGEKLVFVRTSARK